MYNFKANLVLRVLYAMFAVQTFYSPDEYFQCLEVAHNFVFGYGYLTWEWQLGIRSFVYPLLYALPFYLVKVLRVDYPMVVYYVPKVLSGIFAAVYDHYVYRFVMRRLPEGNEGMANVAYVVSWASWYNMYSLSRSFSNSLESVLVMTGLYYFPSQNRSILPFIVIAGISCLIRPTAALFWVHPFLYLLYHSTNKIWVIMTTATVGIYAIITMIAVDFMFYRRFILTIFNFAEFNFVRNLSAFYGTHSWHWMFTQGFPVVSFTLLPFILCKASQKANFLKIFIFSGLCLNSVVAHKEFRFVHPLLAPSIILAAIKLVNMRKMLFFVVASNVIFGGYMSLVHQKGVVNVVKYLGETMQSNETAYFLMPCHSTPFYSTIHRRDVEFKFITCEPPLESIEGYLDESDIFYKNPQAVLNDVTDDYLILFDNLGLNRSDYKVIKSFFNSHFHDDSRRTGRVLVYKKIK
jgi:phosphatidylinositol glycan class B